MSDVTNSHAIEVLAAKLQHERELRERFEEEMAARFRELKEAIATAADANERALQLQATETERRLEGLNNEAGRIAKVLADSVPREVWATTEQSRKQWQEAIEQDITQLRLTLRETEGKESSRVTYRADTKWLIGLGIAIVLALVTLAVRIWTSG